MSSQGTRQRWRASEVISVKLTSLEKHLVQACSDEDEEADTVSKFGRQLFRAEVRRRFGEAVLSQQDEQGAGAD